MRVSFSGHETFPLRFNWLKKAFDEASKKSDIFNSDQAIARFGVGKNMVRSIRHWGLACGVLESDPDVTGGYTPTDFGHQLLGEKGWDPYLEDVGTAWLLHWKLCAAPEPSPLWHFVFAHWAGRGIEIGTVRPPFEDWAEKNDMRLPANSTLKRDLKCLLSTYAGRRSRRNHLETPGSPFVELGLIHDTSGVYHFRRGLQPSLPAEIFVYAVLQFWSMKHGDTKSISIEEVLEEGGSPGRIFKVAQNRAFDLLTEAESWPNPPFTYRDSAGNRQLFRHDESMTAADVLDRYYTHAHHAIA
ncbi:hypothetical protein CRI93_07400 [Longimonas halophila]|uniref:DUF4007 domain-containing protein n=1 Tax=Longimonas halophila TaxID=1469170 RepID=A0A2H3P738_9BACT|nr:DUF4007 family protein [Longimonas halophila]PEN06961.1 hypothetical protein CRI93_07400 [Longimonas halophila]